MKQSEASFERGGLSALQDVIARRIHAERAAATQPSASPFAQATDFSSLPGVQELRLGRSAVDFIGLWNPFFRVHEGRAGPTTVIDGRTLSNFSSYDYLGLNGHPEVQAAAQAAVGRFGSSCSASRLVAGERPLHRTLEDALAMNYGKEDALVFVGGHATNIATISALCGPRDLVIHDSLAHNSIVAGATLSGATRRPFPHNDAPALDRILASCRAQYERVLIVAEGLYSMDGDCADLPALVEVKRRHAAWLMIDEAHGLGVLGQNGKGSFEHFGIDPDEIDIWMGTLSKTLSACGGYIAGCRVLVDYLKFMAGGFVYSVGLPPPMAAAAATALHVMQREPERARRLKQNATLFWTQAKARRLDVGSSEGHAIVPIVVHSSLAAVTLSQKLFERGVNVQPIIHPAVSERHARLRFFLSSEHSPGQITEAVRLLADCCHDPIPPRAPSSRTE